MRCGADDYFCETTNTVQCGAIGLKDKPCSVGRFGERRTAQHRTVHKHHTVTQLEAHLYGAAGIQIKDCVTRIIPGYIASALGRILSRGRHNALQGVYQE